MGLKERARRPRVAARNPVDGAISPPWRVFAEPLGTDRWLVCDREAGCVIVGEICREPDRFVARLWDTAEGYPCATCEDQALALLYFEDYLAALEIGS